MGNKKKAMQTDRSKTLPASSHLDELNRAG